MSSFIQHHKYEAWAKTLMFMKSLVQLQKTQTKFEGPEGCEVAE